MQKSRTIRKRSKTARLQPLSVTRMWAEPVGRYGDGTDDHVTDMWIREKVSWAVCVSRKGQRSAQVWTHVLQSHFRHAQSGHMWWGSVVTWASWDRPLRALRSGRRPLFGPFSGCFVIVRLLILDDVFIFLVICDFSCSCLLISGCFWCFYVCQFLFCGCFLKLFVSLWCWFLRVVMFCCSVCCYFVSVGIVLCLCDHLCVFGRCVFLLVRYYVCKDAPPPPTSVIKSNVMMLSYSHRLQHQSDGRMNECVNQCERLQLLLASLTLTLWPGV